MISAEFIFKPGTNDDEFHTLDTEIEAFVVTIEGYQIVISEVVRSYSDGGVETIAKVSFN